MIGSTVDDHVTKIGRWNWGLKQPPAVDREEKSGLRRVRFVVLVRCEAASFGDGTPQEGTEGIIRGDVGRVRCR